MEQTSPRFASAPSITFLLAGAFLVATSGCQDSSGSSGPGSSSLEGDSGWIAQRYPADAGIENDPAVLFHSGFEEGFSGWGWKSAGPEQVAIDSVAASAHGGKAYLRERVTRAMLASQTNVSSQIQIQWGRPVDTLHVRFHARFVGKTATPHHWVRIAAGTPEFSSDGLANTVPAGDQGFWFDLDARSGDQFAFYVYWYKMRSGRCNDGSTTPGCAGDQEVTYHYGNNFFPAGQPAFPRDQWFCLEIEAVANHVGHQDGSLALWRNDTLVGRYAPGTPRGRWLRDNFFTWGEYYRPEQDFEGFDFRSSPTVKLRKLALDAYYQENTIPEAAPDTQEIHYDDVVVATSRIGCRR